MTQLGSDAHLPGRRRAETGGPVPLVRCHLSAPPEKLATLRYVPLAEFGLWKHLMETRHRRRVRVESVSLWISEDPFRWSSGFEPDDLEPVLRVRLEIPGPLGKPVPIERFFPAETYPEARAALLSHFGRASGSPRLLATPGYFVLAREESAAAVS